MKILKYTLCVLSMVGMSNAIAQDNAYRPHLAAVMSGSNTSQSTTEAKKEPQSTTKKDLKEAKQYLSDTEITAKVKEKFIQEKLFGKDKIAAMGIRVKTNKGVVTLSGRVSSQEEIDTAVKLAKSVEGVKDVTSAIKVKAAKK